MSPDEALKASDFLPQTIGFPQRLLIVVGHGHQKRCDLDFVEAAKRVAEALLTKVQWADIHDAILDLIFPIGHSLRVRQAR